MPLRSTSAAQSWRTPLVAIGAKALSFGLVIDYANTLLRTAYSSQLIDHSFQGTLQANYGIANQVVVGLDLPIDLMSGKQQLDGFTDRAMDAVRASATAAADSVRGEGR